jgi:hypothetical protein
MSFKAIEHADPRCQHHYVDRQSPVLQCGTSTRQRIIPTTEGLKRLSVSASGRFSREKSARLWLLVLLYGAENTMNTATLKTERQAAAEMEIDRSTLLDHRVAGLITPVYHKPNTVSLYDPLKLADELIERGRSDHVQDAARRWRERLKAERRTIAKENIR